MRNREESLYVKSLLREYKDTFSPKVYSVTYQLPSTGEKKAQLFGHNDGIEFVIQYIRQLEDENERLQYIENIVNVAQKEKINYDK